MKPRPMTKADVRFLKGMRISPDDICVVCQGEGWLNDRVGCTACHRTGTKPARIHKDACTGGGCDCADTNHAERKD